MYTEQHLVDFGNYVLSSYRNSLIETHPELSISSTEAAKQVVSDADLSNFLESRSPEEF